MKNKHYIFLLALTLILIFSPRHVFAGNSSFSSDYDEFVKSNEYETIIQQEVQELEHVKKILGAEQITYTPEQLTSLPFEKISKVYVDTGIENINSANKTEIMELLQDCTYVWVVPIELDTHQVQLTFANQPSKGWKVTEVAVVEISSYYATLTEISTSSDYTDTILIGGLPYFRMPMALAFEDDTASAWIDMGYAENIAKDFLTETKTYSISKDSTQNIYDYESVMASIQDKLATESHQPNSSGGGAGGTISYGLIYFIIGALLVFGGIIFIIIRDSRKSDD